MAYTSVATVQEPQEDYLGNYSSNLEWEILEAERTPKKNVRYDPHSKPEAPNIRRTPTQGRPIVEIQSRPDITSRPRNNVPFRPQENRNNQIMRPAGSIPQFPPPPKPITDINQLRKTNIPNSNIEIMDIDPPRQDINKGPEKLYVPRAPPVSEFTSEARLN